ncbi:hypothetical protein [Algibacter sp. 2305UL17-15]|uniref:hypothetical protein n=1 Tax=Algibacter sp. 2305UL17-15 TaxID=3231268 RepID=UPI0034588A61
MNRIFFILIVLTFFNCIENAKPKTRIESSSPEFENFNLPFNPEEKINTILEQQHANAFYDYVDLVGNTVYIKSRTTPFITIFNINNVTVNVIEDKNGNGVSPFKVVFNCNDIFHNCIAVYRTDGYVRKTANLDDVIIYVDDIIAAKNISTSFEYLKLNLNSVSE